MGSSRAGGLWAGRPGAVGGAPWAGSGCSGGSARNAQCWPGEWGWEASPLLSRGQAIQAGVQLGRASRRGAKACCWRGTRPLGACLGDRGRGRVLGRPPRLRAAPAPQYLLCPITGQIL